MKVLVRVAICALVLLPTISLAIDNTKARRDVNGDLMDVHDGNVIKGTDWGDFFVSTFGIISSCFYRVTLVISDYILLA